MAETTSGSIEVSCPKCGGRMRVQTYASINRQQDGEAAKRLGQGTLFDAKCPSCGAVTELNYPVLYHDMAHRLMVQYVSGQEDVRRALQTFHRLLAGSSSLVDAGPMSGAASERMGEVVASQYCLRVVTTHNALREKALIADAGLDDRVVEVAKAVALYQLEGAEVARSAEAYFDGVDGGDVAVSAFVAGKARELVLPSQLLSQVREGMDANRNADGFRIDRAWAVRALGIGPAGEHGE